MAEAEAEEVARQTRNRNNKENPQKKHCLGTFIEKKSTLFKILQAELFIQ